MMPAGFLFLYFSFLQFWSFAASFHGFAPVFPSFNVLPEASSLPSKEKGYATKYFTQTLDHFNFNPQSYETFQQRFLTIDKYWGGAQEKAPIFVYTGNEGDIEWFAQNTGFMLEAAPPFRALLVFIEHRYYGKSVPFGGNKDIAYSNASTLGYLSSTQALADFAILITDLKKNLSAPDSPVVAFGGSYGGMLAAWLRLKYPHIAVGALASSAPVLGFEGLTSPYAFNDVITQDFRSESESCYKVLKGSWRQIEEMAKHRWGLKRLQKSLRLCKKVSADSIENWLYSAIVYTAMTDYPTAANFVRPLPAYPVREMCRAVDDLATGNDTLAKLHGAMNVYYNHTGEAKCFDPDGGSTSSSLGLSGWRWQACTEMIMPTSGSDNESIFPAAEWSYAARASSCRMLFGLQPRPHWITTEFGGHRFGDVLRRSGSNIIFFNGLRDPWSSGGVVKSISKTLVALVAPHGAHHVDLRFSTPQDPEWLRDVRKRERSIIRHWLSQYYDDLGR